MDDERFNHLETNIYFMNRLLGVNWTFSKRTQLSGLERLSQGIIWTPCCVVPSLGSWYKDLYGFHAGGAHWFLDPLQELENVAKIYSKSSLMLV